MNNRNWTFLDDREKAAALSSFRSAVFHLLSCWDALKDLEDVLEDEVETDAIQGIAGGLGDPSEAFQISEEDAAECLDDYFDTEVR